MEVIYAREALSTSETRPTIYLAGPTPRSKDVRSWRKEALALLTDAGYEGIVFVPENRDGAAFDEERWDEQVAWEHLAMSSAWVLAFWIPRDMETLPGMTTNIEFGYYVRRFDVILGFPEGAPHTRYLAHLARKHRVPVLHTLDEVLTVAEAKIIIGS